MSVPPLPRGLFEPGAIFASLVYFLPSLKIIEGILKERESFLKHVHDGAEVCRPRFVWRGQNGQFLHRFSKVSLPPLPRGLFKPRVNSAHSAHSRKSLKESQEKENLSSGYSNGCFIFGVPNLKTF